MAGTGTGKHMAMIGGVHPLGILVVDRDVRVTG